MASVNPIQVEKFLKGVDYPASKEDLVSHAERQLQILPRVIEILKQLPDQTYDGPVALAKTVGEIDRRLKSPT